MESSAAIVPVPGSTLQGLVYSVDGDTEDFVPSANSISLDDVARIGLVRLPAPAGSYTVGIIAYDLVGNESKVGSTVVIK